MADVKISDLPAGTTPAAPGSEVFPVVQSAQTVKLTIEQVRSFILGSANTFTNTLTVSGASFGLSGDISAPAWTTNGIRYKNASGTLTDTTSSGTVAAAYSNVFGGSTIAATNATTFTNYFNTYIKAPIAGTNVTFTNNAALGADSLYVAGNVGIGTTSPATTLSVSGSGYLTGGLGVGVVDTAAGHIHSYVNTSSNSPTLTLEQAGSGDISQRFIITGTQVWIEGIDHADSNKFKISSVDDGFVAANVRMTINTSGNVGIGTTTPAARLSVGTTAATAYTSNLATDASNWERAYLGDWGNVANVATFGPDKLGTGTYRPGRWVSGGLEIWRSRTNGDFQIGSGSALATNATGGFALIASGAGTPTGVPANAAAGETPIYVDTTNAQLWLYLGGAWKQPKTPAGAALVTWQ